MSTRRTFMLGSGGALVGVLLRGGGGGGPRPLHVAGTTLEHTIVAGTDAVGGPYRPLRIGPPQAVVTRSELAGGASAGEVRAPIAHVVQLTDVHVTDAQSPGRVEFLDAIGPPFTASYRPQELLTTQVHHSMVRRVNEVGRSGPWTGRAMDCVISTGDNIDNQQHNELAWFITGMDGGPIAPNSGGADYEGVQRGEWPDTAYWRPEGAPTDPFRARGFPEVPGYLAAAVAPFDSDGVRAPWYATYGNHDGLMQGTIPSSPGLGEIATGALKLVGAPPGTPPMAFAAEMIGTPDEVIAAMRAGSAPTVEVTPDEQRRFVSTREWVSAHLAPGDGPGPHGHGFTEDNLERPGLYFRFDISEQVVGISLDTGGFNSGSIGEDQFRWLEAELRKLHSHELGEDGRARPTVGQDRLVVLFSHFPLDDLTGAPPDPARPQERRVLRDEIRAMLHRWGNVVAWVNGHHHRNVIQPRPDPAGRTAGFWEITTASHVDFPQQARSIELAVNDDGSLSIFTTVVEHAAPHEVDLDDLGPLGLAALSRELAANSMSVEEIARLDEPAEHLNTRLLLPAPFPLEQSPAATPTRATTPSDGDTDLLLPAAAGLGGVALAAVLARRARRISSPPAPPPT